MLATALRRCTAARRSAAERAASVADDDVGLTGRLSLTLDGELPDRSLEEVVETGGCLLPTGSPDGVG